MKRDSVRKDVQPKPARDYALDFVKGFLVLVMVGHHSFEYFKGKEYHLIKYIDFVTGAFVFISGFVVSSIYGARLASLSSSTCWRLLWRGCKLVLLFLALNTGINLLLKVNYDGQRLGLVHFYAAFFSVFFAGNKKVASFEILLPIAYTLCASGLFLLLARAKLLLAAPVFVLLALCLMLQNPPFNLYYLTIGLSGFATGLYCDKERLGTIARRHRLYLFGCACIYTFLIAYLRKDNLVLYLFGILSVVGAVYLCARDFNYNRSANRAIVLLGQYSLLGYLAHILFLQLLFRLIHYPMLSAASAVLPFTLACTFLVVLCYLVQNFRERFASADRIYRFVFP
jgi:peptidoglycan/LPS O-acetylase OafA/YrhL